MKPSIFLLALAALATSSCLDHQSHLRRSQRLGSEVSFWQLPAAYVQALDENSMPRAYTPLIPTSGMPGTQQGFDTGLAPIFDLFRDELPSETAPLNSPPVLSSAEAMANARSRLGFSQPAPRLQAPVESAPSFGHLPYAIAVPGKPGFVTVPGHPNLGEVDVVGITPGTPVEVPAGASTVQFRVP